MVEERSEIVWLNVTLLRFQRMQYKQLNICLGMTSKLLLRIFTLKKPAHGISKVGNNVWKEAETPFPIANGNINIDHDHASAPQISSPGKYFLPVENLDCPMTEAGENFPNETSDNQVICANGAHYVLSGHAPDMCSGDSSLHT